MYIYIYILCKKFLFFEFINMYMSDTLIGWYNYMHAHIDSSMYHQQQNKWYPQRCSLAHFEATFYYSSTELSFKMGK